MVPHCLRTHDRWLGLWRARLDVTAVLFSTSVRSRSECPSVAMDTRKSDRRGMHDRFPMGAGPPLLRHGCGLDFIPRVPFISLPFPLLQTKITLGPNASMKHGKTLIWLDLKTWRKFVYELVYPAVLGSMLYDVLHFKNVQYPGPIGLLKVAITLFYCADWYFLHAALHVEENATPTAMVVDGLVALFLGVAYWLAFEEHPGAAFLLWCGVSVLFFIYSFGFKKVQGSKLRIGSLALFVLTLLSAYLHHYWPPTACLSILLDFAPLAIYVVFVSWAGASVAESTSTSAGPT
jgi:hypothetical protein